MRLEAVFGRWALGGSGLLLSADEGCWRDFDVIRVRWIFVKLGVVVFLFGLVWILRVAG